jgi:hypothetical protein
VSMPSNSAFAWLKSRIGPAPLERPPSPQVVVVAEAAAVQASPPPVESLEEVLVKGRPALSTEVAQWLEQLSGEHCTDVERAQKLYTELLVTQGGDAQAVETRLAAVAIAADVQVVRAHSLLRLSVYPLSTSPSIMHPATSHPTEPQPSSSHTNGHSATLNAYTTPCHRTPRCSIPNHTESQSTPPRATPHCTTPHCVASDIITVPRPT